MGIQAVKGVEIGAGFGLAELRGSEAHDEIFRDERGLYRETNRAGGIEGGVSNGEELVVRAAMKPLPTLMRPLASVDLQTGEPADALVERSDVSAVEALAVVAETAVAFELARAAREEFGGDELDAFVVHLHVDADTAWARVQDSRRPLARDEGDFRERYARRQPLYEQAADARAEDADGVVLATAGVTVGHVPAGVVPGHVPAEIVADARVLELHPPPRGAPLHPGPP